MLFICFYFLYVIYCLFVIFIFFVLLFVLFQFIFLYSECKNCICHQQGYKQGKGKQFNKPRATLFSKNIILVELDACIMVCAAPRLINKLDKYMVFYRSDPTVVHCFMCNKDSCWQSRSCTYMAPLCSRVSAASSCCCRGREMGGQGVLGPPKF